MKDINLLLTPMKSFKTGLVIFFSLFFYTATLGQASDSLVAVNKNDDKKKIVIPTKDSYLFVYDGLYDMTGSAQDLISVSHLFGRGLDELICKTDKSTGFNYCGTKDNFFGRMLIDFGLNFLFTNWISTVQHECMGHGFRAREFDARIHGYYVAPGIFGGKAYVDLHKEDLPYYGLLLYQTGGSESNTVFSRESFRQSLLNDYFYHYYFYLFALKVDLPMYILGTPKVNSYQWNNPEDGDIVNYIKNFKRKSEDEEQQILNYAKKGAYWSLADPSLLISLFNYFSSYIVQGKSQIKNPMIRIKNIRFLPFTDFHLSPFGYEYYIGTYLKYNQTLYEAYYRWSFGNMDGKSYGVGMNILNMVQYHHFRFDAGFDLWKQDFNMLYYETDSGKYNETVLSGKIFLKTYYQINNTCSLFAQASYKGDGFLIGHPIKNGFNSKIGLNFHF